MDNLFEIFEINMNRAPEPEDKNIYIYPQGINGTCRYHRFFQPHEELSIVFVNKEQKIRRLLIDENGMIQDFPGILEEDCWTCEYAMQYLPTKEVRYGAYFYPLDDGRFLAEWTIQPDGRFWMDRDGFGAEDYLSIILYSTINALGEFEHPFKVYSVGDQEYYGGKKL